MSDGRNIYSKSLHLVIMIVEQEGLVRVIHLIKIKRFKLSIWKS